MNWTLIFTFYDSLPLAHLERSAFSLSKQTVKPTHYVFFDNNSPFQVSEMHTTITRHLDVTDWDFFFCRHRDPAKTLSWNNNAAIRFCRTDAFIMFRADIIHDFTFCEEMLNGYAGDPNTFVGCSTVLMPYASGAIPETVDHATDLEHLDWRSNPKRLLSLADGARGGILKHDGWQDSASFMSSKFAMEKAGWYDEALIGWGYDQQSLQTAMASNGVRIVNIKKPLLFHMMHELTGGKKRDTKLARAIWLKSPRRIPEILAAEARLRE